jgi:DNA repair protein RadA/Sms
VPKESPILATTVIFLQKQKTQNIFKQIEAIEPEIVIIDSIQTLHTDYIESTAGTISQIRETTQSLLNLRKQYTRNSDRAHNKRMALLQDRKFWEHMVDTVLQFEGDRNHVYHFTITEKSFWLYSRNWDI